MSDDEKIQWYLEWFDVNTEELAGELLVEEMDVEKARKIVGVAASDPMADLFELNEKSAENLREFVDFEFIPEKYAYFFGPFTVS